MKKYIFGLVLTILLPSLALGAFRFKDDGEIPSWAQEAVYTVREKNIMKGFPDGNFGPKRTINRAQALVLLFRTQEVEFEDSQNFAGTFSDIPENAWFTKAVYKAVERGWIKGFSDGTFRPEKEVNKAEWATLVQRAFDLEPDPENLPGFTDVPSDSWFSEPVQAFYKNELVRHPNVEKFNPSEGVSRGEAAWVIKEILGKPRLMGTSKENDFSTNVKRDSKKVAIKPRNFNPNDQGVESTRKELDISTNFDNEAQTIHADSDWTYMGNMRLKNNFEERVTLNSLEFGLRFDLSGRGPSYEFELKVSGPGFEKTQSFSRTTNFITGINLPILGGQEKVLKVSIKPKEDAGFYTKSGTAALSIDRAEAITTSTFTVDADNPTAGYETNLKQTPIKFVSRKFTEIFFDPYPTEEE